MFIVTVLLAFCLAMSNINTFSSTRTVSHTTVLFDATAQTSLPAQIIPKAMHSYLMSKQCTKTFQRLTSRKKFPDLLANNSKVEKVGFRTEYLILYDTFLQKCFLN